MGPSLVVGQGGVIFVRVQADVASEPGPGVHVDHGEMLLSIAK